MQSKPYAHARPAFFAVCLAAVLLDAASKAWAQSLPAPLYPASFLCLRPVYNHGASFGLLSSLNFAPALLAGLACAACAALCRHALARPCSAWRCCACALACAGSAANAFERAVWGKVTDFLAFGAPWAQFPVFNLADAFICAGLAALVWTASHDNS